MPMVRQPQRGPITQVAVVMLDELYNADPILEPELVGLTNAQVMVQRQVVLATQGNGESFDRIADRVEGRPKQVNENLNLTVSYQDYLDEITRNEQPAKS